VEEAIERFLPEEVVDDLRKRFRIGQDSQTTERKLGLALEMFCYEDEFSKTDEGSEWYHENYGMDLGLISLEAHEVALRYVESRQEGVRRTCSKLRRLRFTG
ncbi:hypothetical protein HOE51_04380, partial [archaeon]|nr:hypothetical protein [archaeon]